MAEAIWMISSNGTNLNHMIIAINGYNQLTFNASIILLLAAFGSLTIKQKSDKLPLCSMDICYDQIASLDIVNDPNARKMLFDFLSLFQSYQSLMNLPAARDESICDAFTMKSTTLKLIEQHLKNVLQSLSKAIRDEKELNENTLVRLLVR